MILAAFHSEDVSPNLDLTSLGRDVICFVLTRRMALKPRGTLDLKEEVTLGTLNMPGMLGNKYKEKEGF